MRRASSLVSSLAADRRPAPPRSKFVLSFLGRTGRPSRGRRDPPRRKGEFLIAGSTPLTMPLTSGIHRHRVGRQGKAVGLLEAGGFAV